MAPGTLQLFPPPERPIQKPMPPNWPSRTTSRREAGSAQASAPIPERMDYPKSQADFHELIIRVNSPAHSSEEIQVPILEAPQRARLANPKTPPQQTNPTFEHPPRSWGVTVTPPERNQGYGIYPIRNEPARPNYSHMRNVSPAPGDRPSAQNDFGLSPISPMSQNGRGASPTPYGDHAGAIGIAISSESPSPYSRRGMSPTPSEGHMAGIGINIFPASPSSPEHARVASPAFSETLSARSNSPTLVRSNSAATAASRQSPARSHTEPAPVMRSIFPRYNPEVPLGKQSYLPMITTPPSRIPRDKIHRPLNTQTYTPHANIGSFEDEDPAPRQSAVMPYYTPPQAFDSLWDAANGQGIPMVQVYTLQIHRKVARTANCEPQLIFGPSESQPFYTLSHTSLAPDLLDDEEDDADHELLITRHNPSKPTSLPISHFTLSPTPSLSPLSPVLSDESIKQSCALITTIYPKMAAITALDAAAQSPAASRIALTDPDATSPAAERLAQDVLLGTAQRECCALVWTRAGFPQPAHFISASPGTYALHHPSLGVFPITHEGDITPGLSPILGSNPFNSRQRPTRINKPTRITILNPFSTPAEERRPDTPSDDGVLARLDFGNDSLVLNVAAILRLGNPYLIDVIVSALLSVALAEEKRVRREMRFEAPPMPLTPQMRSNSAASQDKGKKGFWHRVGKRAEKKVREKVKENARTDSGIGLVEWAGPPKEGAKGEKEEDMPFVTTAILGLLTFTFKTTVWVLGITIKIVAGVVVKVSHWVVEKA